MNDLFLYSQKTMNNQDILQSNCLKFCTALAVLSCFASLFCPFPNHPFHDPDPPILSRRFLIQSPFLYLGNALGSCSGISRNYLGCDPFMPLSYLKDRIFGPPNKFPGSYSRVSHL
jgi:hypothetical protein